MFNLQYEIHEDKLLKIEAMTKDEVLDCWREGSLPGNESRSARIDCYENILIVRTISGDAIYDRQTGEGYELTITEL